MFWSSDRPGKATEQTTLLPQHNAEIIDNEEPESNGGKSLDDKLKTEISFLADVGLREAVIAVIAYISLGVYAFSYRFEQWDIVDSIYFSITTLTTVGKHKFVQSCEKSFFRI